MEFKKLSQLFITVLMAFIITACGSSDAIDESDAPEAVNTETKDMSNTDGTEGDVNDGAQAQGTGDDAVLEGSDVMGIDKDSLTITYYFMFDSNSLSDDTRAELDKVAMFMKTNAAKFQLHGHADETGTREYNLALSERRAKSVEDYLALQGIERSRIEVIGFGEEKPANPASSEAAYKENRRVELKFQ
jgi:peptidoglycan-associated lipoprotein